MHFIVFPYFTLQKLRFNGIIETMKKELFSGAVRNTGTYYLTEYDRGCGTDAGRYDRRGYDPRSIDTSVLLPVSDHIDRY